MKIALRKIGWIALGLAVLGALVVVSGVVPITASSGHWAVTKWFLHFGMARSVATHSLGIEVPPFTEGMVLKGAGQYEIGCRSCHGSPSFPQPRIAQAMSPSPPYLPPRLPGWDSEELFYIVKHGVKFTGMPAWPSQKRDDEVWAMVAFLRRLPQLSSAEYQDLVQAKPDPAEPMQEMLTTAAPAVLIRSCMPCHGSNGLGRGHGSFPKLAGQRREYLQNTLAAYAKGSRHSGIMGPIAASLSADEIDQLARHYAALPHATRPSPIDPASVERGRQIAERGKGDQRLPSCVDCHGPKKTPQKNAYPALAGQYADYLILQLELFKKGVRGGTAYAHLMHEVAHRLKEKEMHDVANYFASLPWKSSTQGAQAGEPRRRQDPSASPPP